MRGVRITTYILSVFLFFISCSDEAKRPTIALFQQKVTAWDEMLLSDFRAESALYGDIDFEYYFASSPTEQASQIDAAVQNGVNALVVNVLDVEVVLPSVEKAFDSGVYVVLVGNMIPSRKFHTYAGMNNSELGTMAGRLIKEQLGYGGHIIELGAKSNQTWFLDRRDGFHKVIDADNSLEILASVDCEWSQDLALAAMDSLKTVIDKNDVEAVFSYGDDMLIGAIKSGAFPNAKFIGTDGIPGESLHYISTGEISYSILTQTGGMEAIDAAANLIKGLSSEKYIFCQPILVDSSNVEAISSALEKIHYFSQKNAAVKGVNDVLEVRLLHYIPAAYIAVFCILLNLVLSIVVRLFRKNLSSTKEEAAIMEQQFTELSSRNENLDLQRKKLEEERDALLVAPTPNPEDCVEGDMGGLFVRRLKASMERHYSEANYSIDALAAELGVSRAQLFRKVKTQLGETPNDLLQSMRLKKADDLLKTTELTVSEIAYSTGFSSPSYFSKCYKDKFGKLPSSGRK